MRSKVFILNFTVFLLFSFLPSTIIASEYDVDGNGVDDALTDGLLVLRHEFGLTGETLTAGALAPDATVTSPEAIANFINQRASVFDLDGNGALDALTDGLLLLRHLFGLSGDAMTNGVIGFGFKIGRAVRGISEFRDRVQSQWPHAVGHRTGCGIRTSGS